MNITQAYVMTKRPSKKEARLLRKAAKEPKKIEKSVRLSSSIEIKDKYIRASIKPDLVKIPRSTSPNNYREYYLTWCVSNSDTDDDWSWNEPRQWSDAEFTETIKPHMDGCSSNAWKDIEVHSYNGKKGFRKLSNKHQPLNSICEEAQSRWLSLEGLLEFDELFRFRLGTNKRIWGVRILHHFYLVWYERNHLICPIKN